MLPRPNGIFFSPARRALWLVGIFLFLTPTDLQAKQTADNVICREDLSRAHREQLAAKLRKITGLPDLKFDSDGVLLTGSATATGGSASARKLIENAISGDKVILIEAVSDRSEVAFCRVVPGSWTKNAASRPPAFIIQIDFADFDLLVGDKRALQAFNVGWGLLHELDHIVNESPDATSLGEAGECEAHINQMRRECNLPQRADYFYTQLPLNRSNVFVTRLVRLAFEQQQPHAKKKKRYWVVWDANVVGGLNQDQIAALP